MNSILYNQEELDTQHFKCENCGGTAIFSPKHQQLQCEYCKSLFAIPNSENANEHNLNELLNSSSNWETTQVILCENCAGKQVIDNNEISAICCFCGSTNMVKTSELTGLAPQGIVPFKVGADLTVSHVKKWANGKYFAPSAFKKRIQPKNIQGVYYPVFTFDANTYTTYSGRLYKNYTKTYYRNGQRHTRTERRYFNIQGDISCKFDDIIITASNGVSQKDIAILQPFPTNSAIKYNPNYLNGYTALTYSESGKSCWNKGTSEMETRIKNKALNKYSYSGVVSFNQNTKFNNVSYKFILLPLYIGHFKYKNITYNFYINGFNGKVSGKTPVSTGKIVLLILAILLAIFLPFVLFLIFNSIEMSAFMNF